MANPISVECRELMELQRGVLARWQATGLPDARSMDAQLRSGRWQTLYRAVYTGFTGPPSRDSWLWAAVLRCGPAAALSHVSAAEADGFGDRRGEAIHVTVPGSQRMWFCEGEFTGGIPRIVVHRSARLAQTRHPAKAPPRTRVAETVLDLADDAKTFDVAFGWLSAACSSRLVTPGQVREAAERRAKLRWRADLAVALEEISDGVHSNLERGYVRHVESPHGLPKARRQVRMKRGSGSAYLDNLYDGYAVAVELDGLAWHPARARLQDVHRDNHFARSGIITLRYNWAEVTSRSCWVAAEIGDVLRVRGWTGTIRSCGPSCQVRSS